MNVHHRVELPELDPSASEFRRRSSRNVFTAYATAEKHAARRRNLRAPTPPNCFRRFAATKTFFQAETSKWWIP